MFMKMINKKLLLPQLSDVVINLDDVTPKKDKKEKINVDAEEQICEEQQAGAVVEEILPEKQQQPDDKEGEQDVVVEPKTAEQVEEPVVAQVQDTEAESKKVDDEVEQVAQEQQPVIAQVQEAEAEKKEVVEKKEEKFVSLCEMESRDISRGVNVDDAELHRLWSPSPEKKQKGNSPQVRPPVEPEEFGSYDQTPIRLSKRHSEMLRNRISTPKPENQRVVQVDIGCFSSGNSPQLVGNYF